MKKLLSIILTLMFVGTVSAQTFTDVSEKHWAYEFVEDCVAKGVINDGYFYYPEQLLTRAELVKMMVEATTGILDDVFPEANPFLDITDFEKWYYPFIQTAHMTKIVDGYKDGKFRPSNNVTRAEAMKIIVNALGIEKNYKSKFRFRDYSKTEWFHIYVVSAYEAGIVKGRGGRVFAPGAYVTRAEMAKIISKALKVSDLY